MKKLLTAIVVGSAVVGGLVLTKKLSKCTTDCCEDCENDCDCNSEECSTDVCTECHKAYKECICSDYDDID